MVAGLVDDGNPSALCAGESPVYPVEMIVNAAESSWGYYALSGGYRVSFVCTSKIL